MKIKLFCWILAALFLFTTVNAGAQSEKKMPRIGHLLQNSASRGENVPLGEALRQGLRELGYVEGKNIAIEVRSAEAKLDRLPELAAELVRLKVDVLLAGGGTTLRAAKQATSTIPIVMTQGPDPIVTGLIASLARPGGNITGLTQTLPGLHGKRLELLKESFPSVTHMALLWDPSTPGAQSGKKEMDSVAQSMGVKLQAVDIAKIQRWDEELSSLKRQGVGAVLLLGLNFATGLHTRISEVTLKNRLPVMWVNCRPPEMGDLMCYSPNIADLYHRAARFVDKILKGAKPADLPVEQPMKFDFVINLKTAKQIGVTVQPAVLYRADRVFR